MAHWVWGGGWLADHGTLDWAGGVPVEMASGFSAFAAAIVVGARKDYGRQAVLPHNSVYVLVGAGLLWFGWFGFNGGSGLNALGRDALVHEHAARAGRDARRLDRARLRAQREGDGDRRRDGDHRRLRPDHAGRRLHQPDVGDPARRARRDPELLLHRLAAAARASTRRSTCSPRTGSAASSGSSSSASSRSASWNGISDGLLLRRRRRSCGTRRRRSLAAPVYAFVGTYVLLRLIGARHAAAGERARRGHPASTSRSTARRRTSRATARSSSRPRPGFAFERLVAQP